MYLLIIFALLLFLHLHFYLYLHCIGIAFVFIQLFYSVIQYLFACCIYSVAFLFIVCGCIDDINSANTFSCEIPNFPK